ncbi:hypothetical protein IU447_23995 [Nocardia farcinica]|uniref:hypothetical protein n=1 Tax=Nocardia farcinica TaxID=37329 RepID=UPI001894AEDF|nr:hypothetical protein [Nocardia farcinica]MBF6363182.1 hypothetical protein [Nocardia farcinica]
MTRILPIPSRENTSRWVFDGGQIVMWAQPAEVTTDDGIVEIGVGEMADGSERAVIALCGPARMAWVHLDRAALGELIEALNGAREALDLEIDQPDVKFSRAIARQMMAAAEDHGRTCEELAAVLGVEPLAISRFQAGTDVLNVDQLSKAAQWLGLGAWGWNAWVTAAEAEVGGVAQ